MHLAEALCNFATAKSALAAEDLPAEHPALLDALNQRRTQLTSAIAASELSLDDNTAQQRESEGFRGNAGLHSIST